MSEQECFLSVNKHLFFASGAKQPCSVPLCGTPLKASERKQNSAWRSRAPHVYIQIWDKYMLPFFPFSILNIFTGETVPCLLWRASNWDCFSVLAAAATKVSTPGSPRKSSGGGSQHFRWSGGTRRKRLALQPPWGGSCEGVWPLYLHRVLLHLASKC